MQSIVVVINEAQSVEHIQKVCFNIELNMVERGHCTAVKYGADTQIFFCPVED
jgi:hypothetical protein